jgi:hypothetical protein
VGQVIIGKWTSIVRNWNKYSKTGGVDQNCNVRECDKYSGIGGMDKY